MKSDISESFSCILTRSAPGAGSLGEWMVDSALSRRQFILQEWPGARWTSLSLFGSPSVIESGVAMNGRARRGETPARHSVLRPCMGRDAGGIAGGEWWYSTIFSTSLLITVNIVEMASLKSARYMLNINDKTISDYFLSLLTKNNPPFTLNDVPFCRLRCWDFLLEAKCEFVSVGYLTKTKTIKEVNKQ